MAKILTWTNVEKVAFIRKLSACYPELTFRSVVIDVSQPRILGVWPLSHQRDIRWRDPETAISCWKLARGNTISAILGWVMVRHALSRPRSGDFVLEVRHWQHDFDGSGSVLIQASPETAKTCWKLARGNMKQAFLGCTTTGQGVTGK